MGNCPTQMESMGRTGIILAVLPQIFQEWQIFIIETPMFCEFFSICH